MGSSMQKMKLLYLARLFFEETDETQGLTMPEIIEALEELEISAERKGLYRDIATLQEFGFDIRKLKTSPVQYALVKREFSMAELLLLADAVQSSRFLTQSKSNALIASIKTLGSKRQVKRLNRHLHVEGRIKTQNESVFYNIDIIEDAIRSRNKVAFNYFKYDGHKQPVIQHDGERYVETPVQLLYSDNFYYLVAYSEAYDRFTHYRVDRMTDVEVTDIKAQRNTAIANFDAAEYQARMFSMYAGDVTACSLLVHESAMSGIIDRFGAEVRVAQVDGEWSTIHVTVAVSPVFFGWVAQFGGKVRIAKPQSVADEYVAYLRQLIDEA